MFLTDIMVIRLEMKKVKRKEMTKMARNIDEKKYSHRISISFELIESTLYTSYQLNFLVTLVKWH